MVHSNSPGKRRGKSSKSLKLRIVYGGGGGGGGRIAQMIAHFAPIHFGFESLCSGTYREIDADIMINFQCSGTRPVESWYSEVTKYNFDNPSGNSMGAGMSMDQL